MRRGGVADIDALAADDELSDIRLAAGLRRAFREAQLVMSRALASCDLSEQRYHLLLAVAAAGETGVVQGALGVDLHCPVSRISLLVHELSEAGLVETVRLAPDRRQVRVRLTDRGHEALTRAVRAQRHALHGLVQGLDGVDVSRMLDVVIRRYLGIDVTRAHA